MLDLNLTYYESRYILGLGYDFSPVCATFSARGRFADGLDYATMLINPYLQQVGYLKDLNHFKELLQNDEIDFDSITPIIPYDALAKCLPDLEEEKHIKNARVWLGKDLYLTSEDCIYPGDIDGDGVGYGSYFLERLKDQEFKNAYKAFVWCHEKYPDELRAKFEEVMK
jgi:hypothetical protein